jgi:pentatricopeptide repeat protein
LSVFLATLEETSRAAGLPPARCVWHNKLWKYAARRWSLPELLAALKAVDGAGFAEVVRLSGERASATALGLFREGRALGWCDGDGGAAAAAMAWTHDGARQGAQADALWGELHALADAGEIDAAAIRKAGGVKDWDLRRKNNGTDATRLSVFDARVEVFGLEVASKARRRPRAACAAYARLRDGDGDERKDGIPGDGDEGRAILWLGVARGATRRKLPRRVFTAACRAASGARDARFARRVAVDMAMDDVTPDSYVVASLSSLIGKSGLSDDADAAGDVFASARDAGVPLGGAAWSCAVGACCRAGRVDEALSLLGEMRDAPFMRLWPSCPTETKSDEDEEDETFTKTSSLERWTVDARAARKAEAERRAAAPAYAQAMHALCDAGRAREALAVHDDMISAGVYAPANPPHYRALFKALRLAGGDGGSPLTPRKAAAAAVADAVRAATAASEAQSALAVSEDAADRKADLSPSTARDAASSPSRGMAAAMSLAQIKFAGEAIRATLQIAAEAGFPDVSSEARARLRWARVAPQPEDLELTLEAYARAGDPRGAVAHWNANRRALLAEAEASQASVVGGQSDFRGSGDEAFAERAAYTSWEVGKDGVVVLGCEPTRRAWTAAIKAHCDLDEPSEAAALLREAVESEARRGVGGRDARDPRDGGARLRSKVSRTRKPSDANKHRGVERVAFNVVAAAYSRARAPRRAEDLLWLMDAAGVKPDEVTYNTIIGAYASAARPAPLSSPRRRRLLDAFGGAFKADDTVDEMIELALDTVVRFDGEGRLKNNSNAPDEDFARDDDVSDDETPTDAAFRLLREMRSARVGLTPSQRTWTAVLTACARAGDAKRADEAFERMQAMGVKPDRRAWTALIKAHAAGGDLRSAADAYWRMRDAGVTPDEATLSAALAAGPPRDGTTLDAAAAMSLYRDARALDVRPNNEGFRRLTGMWVDQAFDGERAEGKETAGVSEDTIVAASDHDAETTRSRLRSASASSAPDFMLASLVDDDSRDVGGYGARRSVSRKNDRWIDDGDARRPLVDVHGLSTVETRAAVLSVLQALRERRRARLAVSGDLVIVTGSPRARKSKHFSAAGIEQRGSVLGGGVPSETSLRDAVKGLARDLDLVVEDVEQNAGRLVIRERELLKWLDRDRAAARRGAAVPERAAERSAAERTAVERTEKPRDDDDDDDDDDVTRTAASLPRRRRASRRRSKSRDVPGLEGALKEWLRENDSAEIDP